MRYIMNKKINYSDRLSIEAGISAGESFKFIASKIGKHPSSIANEVNNNRTHIPAMSQHSNDCVYSATCSKTHLCGSTTCPFPCKWCRKTDIIGKCITMCKDYISSKCNFLLNPPYVCNLCQMKDRCTKDKFFYSAKDAHAASEKRKSLARSGPRMDDKSLHSLDKLLSTLLGQGQSIAHICNTNDLPVSERTIYEYIDKCYLTVRNLDLRAKVKYKTRTKTKSNTTIIDKSYKIGRSYADFNDYILSNGDYYVSEMDTVIGKQGEKKRLLTIIMRRYSLLLIFLLDDGRASTVHNVFNRLEHRLGLDTFRALFPVILTDNGPEFQNVEGIELNYKHEIRTNVYFCDPMASWQKGSIERIHELIRYILPKGYSFAMLEQKDLTLIMNHINSYSRDSLKGKCPYDLIEPDNVEMMKLMELLKMKRVPAREVNLTPKLLISKK